MSDLYIINTLSSFSNLINLLVDFEDWIIHYPQTDPARNTAEE